MKINKLYNFIFEKIKKIDKKILKLMNYGFTFSFILMFISVILLIIYTFIYEKPNFFYIGLELFKSSIIFITIFIIFGIGFDTIKKEMLL